jgi:tRNA1(Val) A37 N6-methylase TrmN6
MFSIGENSNIAEDYNAVKNNASLPFFLWQLEFARVFKEKGGFDVIIGNPPYVKIQNIDDTQTTILKRKYYSASGKFDIYVLFMEQSFNLINNAGNITFIQPHRFINVDYGDKIRSYLKKLKD